MDSIIKLQLMAALTVRYNLLGLLTFIKEHHIKTIHGSENDFIILSDNNKIWIEGASKYTFLCMIDPINTVMSVDKFYKNRYNVMRSIFTSEISKAIINLYDTLLKIVTEYQEPYNPITTVHMHDHSPIYKTNADGEKQLVTHIDDVPKWIPFDVKSEDQDIISCRSALNLLYDLKCCIDPSVDYEIQQQLKNLQEAYPNEYNFNLTVQD